uniref:ANK_REP_REGION domain-containing protein n=1 Tax=Macrostomum lignano TaxID=282301 RepID=A0A1I8FMZ6_9PLAT
MRVLIDCGADLNAANSLGDTPIYQACLEAAPYLNLPNASGITPLMIACFTGAEAVVELLLRYGARVDCRDVAGKTAAHYCCPARALDCLRLLVRAGVPLEADGSDGTSPLMEAAYQGASDQLLDLLLSAAPESALAARDCRDRGALFYAIEGGSLPTFQRLLRAGASTRAAQPSGVTLLMTAALRYRRRLAELLVDLLRNEADRRDDEDSDGIRARDAEGRNALFYCVANPEPDLLQLLLDSGLPAEKATDGSTLLMACIARRNWTLVDFLLRRADSLAPLVDLAAVDSAGESALTLAVRAQNQQLLHQLIGMGGAAVTDGENFPKRWRRLLQLACQCGNAEAAMLFAEMAKPDDLAVAVRGGDADGEGEGEGEGDDGLLFFCVRGGHVDLTRHFLRLLRGTATAAALADGTTAAGGKNLFHEACATGRLAMVQMLMQELPEQQILLKDAQGRNAYFYARAERGSATSSTCSMARRGLEPTPDNRGRHPADAGAGSGGSGGQSGGAAAAAVQPRPLRPDRIRRRLRRSRRGFLRGRVGQLARLVEDLLTRAGTSEEPRDKGRAGLCSCTAPPAAPPQCAKQLASPRSRELLRIEPGSWMPTARTRCSTRGAGAQLRVGGRLCSSAAAWRRRRIRAPVDSGTGLRHRTGPPGRAAAHHTPACRRGRPADGCDDAAVHPASSTSSLSRRVDHLARLAGLPTRAWLKLLLEAFNGLDVGRCGRMLPAAKDGSTLLHLGARSGNVQVFMHLLRFFVPSGSQQEAAAMLNARDANGTSVAHILPLPERPWCSASCWNRRADPQAADADGSARCTWPYRARAPSKAVRAGCWTGALTPSSRLAPGPTRSSFVRQNPRRRRCWWQDCLQLLESLFQLDQSQRETIEAYSKRLGEVDLAELASQMAKRDVILVMELMNQRAERRDYMLSLVISSGQNSNSGLPHRVKAVQSQVAMELRAKLFVKPESEFMV